MSECKCSLREKLVGDGCRYCQPQEYIDHLLDSLNQKDDWVGLTAKDIEGITLASDKNIFSAIMFTHDKLKDKNYD